MALRLKKGITTRRKSKYDTIASTGHEIKVNAVGNKSAICNRCNRELTVEASYMRGVGPVCARRALAALGALKGQVIDATFSSEMQDALDGITAALANEGKVLCRADDHATRIQEELTDGTERARALEISYEILGDTFNQLPTDARVQGAVGVMFLTVGAADEAEAAKKRLKALAKKFISF